MENVDEPGFDQLRLRQWRRDPQDRLVGEEYGSFRHRMNVAREPQLGKMRKQHLAEAAGAREPIDLLGGKLPHGTTNRRAAAAS